MQINNNLLLNSTLRRFLLLSLLSTFLLFLSFTYFIFLKDYKIDGASYYNREGMGNGNITSVIKKESWQQYDLYSKKELVAKNILKGNFIGETDNLGIIAIPFDTRNNSVSDEIIFRLKQTGEKDWYYQNTYKTNLFQNNIPFPFGFPIISKSKNISYTFEIESLVGKPGKSFSLSKINPYFFTKYKFSKAELTNLNRLSLFIFFKINTRLQFFTIRETALVLLLTLSPFILYLLRYIYIKSLISKKRVKIFSGLNQKKYFFYIATISGILSFLLYGLVTRAQNFYNYFFIPTKYGYFSDFFFPLSEAFDGPYAYGNIYPPLPALIYRFMLRLVPYNIASHGNELIRASHAGQMVFLFYILITLLLLFSLLMEIKKGARIEKYIFGFIVLFSSPFLFTLERGNIIFVALLSSIFFVFFKDSRNRIIREVALISLAVSAAIKIYPAIFGLLLVKEKRFKDILKVFVYGIALFILPIFGLGGISQIAIFFKNIFVISSGVFDDRGVGYSVNIQAMARTIGALFGNFGNFPIFLGKLLSLVVLTLGIISTFFLRSKWKTVALLSLLIALVPSLGYVYALTFMIIPLIMFLDQETKEKWDKVYLTCFILIFIPFTLGKIDFINNGFGVHAMPLTYGLLIQNIALLIMTSYLIWEGLMGNGLKSVRKFLKTFMVNLSNLLTRFDKFYWIVPVFIILVYNLIFFNKYLPITEGWFSTYAWLMNHGQIPYKDFYFFLTPFYPALISAFTNIFGYDILYLRIFGIGVILLMTYFLYKNFQIIFGSAIATFVSIIGMIYYQSGVAHITYDFIQFVTLFGLIQSYFLLKYINPGLKANAQIKWVFWGGIFASLIFLTKQSNGAIIIAFSFAGLFLLSLRTEKKEILKVPLLYICGFIVPILLTCTWLLVNSAFAQFLEQFFSEAVSAKGGLVQILFGWWKEILTYNFIARSKEILFIVFILGYWVYPFKDKKKENKYLDRVIMLAASFVILLIVLSLSINKLPFNELERFVQEGIGRVMVVSVLTPILMILVTVVLFIINKPLNKSIFLFSFVALGFLYGAGTSAGFSEAGAFIGFCLFIALMLYLRSALGLGKIFIVLLCIGFSFLLVERKYTRPYYWWRVTSPDIRTQLSPTNEIPMLKGMYTSEYDIKLIEQVSAEIKKSSKPDDPILLFPNIPVFYLITDRKPPGKAIVHWFDFLPDDLAVKEAQVIRENPPKVIVYLDLGKDVWTAHERLFRDGKLSGQRKIKDAIHKIIKSNKMYEAQKYKLDNDVSISVWKK